MTAGTGFAGTNMLRLVRQQELEFYTLPFAGFRERKGVFVMLLKEARDGFLFDCECRHLAKGSIRNYRAETKFLIEFLELKQITEVEEVKAHHIRDFMKQKQDSGNTACYVNDILKACKTWFNYLVEEDYAVSSMGRSRVVDEILISYLFSPPACQTLEQVI